MKPGEFVGADGTHTCSKCGSVLPANAEFFYRDRRNKNGLTNWCKECRREAFKKWSDDNPEKKIAGQQAYRIAHKEKIAEYNREWRGANQEQRLVSQAAYRNSHRQQRRANFKALRLANPDRYRAYRRNRWAREHNAPGHHTADDVLDQYRRQRGRCYYCREKVGDKYHADHVIPLSRGGTNGPENIVIACPSCNSTKGAKMPSEFCEKLL